MSSEYDDLRPPASLAPVERQQFILLHKLLERFDDGEANHHRQMVEMLTEGFTMEYERLFTPYAELPKDDCRLVFDILEMFSGVKASLSRLGGQDREALLADHGHALLYQGFDGNDALEGKMGSYVAYLLSTGRWTDLREDVQAADGGNSHSPMLSRYRTMLEAYRPVWDEVVHSRGRGPDRYLLDADQLRSVAASRG